SGQGGDQGLARGLEIDARRLEMADRRSPEPRVRRKGGPAGENPAERGAGLRCGIACGQRTGLSGTASFDIGGNAGANRCADENHSSAGKRGGDKSGEGPVSPKLPRRSLVAIAAALLVGTAVGQEP